MAVLRRYCGKFRRLEQRKVVNAPQPDDERESSERFPLREIVEFRQFYQRQSKKLLNNAITLAVILAILWAIFLPQSPLMLRLLAIVLLPLGFCHGFYILVCLRDVVRYLRTYMRLKSAVASHYEAEAVKEIMKSVEKVIRERKKPS